MCLGTELKGGKWLNFPPNGREECKMSSQVSVGFHVNSSKLFLELNMPKGGITKHKKVIKRKGKKKKKSFFVPPSNYLINLWELSLFSPFLFAFATLLVYDTLPFAVVYGKRVRFLNSGHNSAAYGTHECTAIYCLKCCCSFASESHYSYRRKPRWKRSVRKGVWGSNSVVWLSMQWELAALR